MSILHDSHIHTGVYVLLGQPTNVVSSNSEVYLIHQYVIKFVSDLRFVSGFHRALQFPPPIKLTIMI
jgi:hypothetical protein